MLNQTLKIFCFAVALATAVAASGALYAQQPALESPDVSTIRWKTEAQVRELLGEPNSIHGPVGTHSSYTLWKYENFTVAFSDHRAFHVFHKNSLKKFVLEQGS